MRREYVPTGLGQMLSNGGDDSFRGPLLNRKYAAFRSKDTGGSFFWDRKNRHGGAAAPDIRDSDYLLTPPSAGLAHSPEMYSEH